MNDPKDRSPLIANAKRDQSTVNEQGIPITQSIDGVFVHKPTVHVDHRGALVEMFTTPEFWKADFAYAYQTSIRPGTVKGWFAHEQKSDRYHIVSGELLVLLYDDRIDSPTCGLVQKLVLSEASDRQVFIPPLVWHLSLNVGQTDAILVNLPTTLYDHKHPDRLHISIDSGEIPVNVRSFFPTISTQPHEVAATFC